MSGFSSSPTKVRISFFISASLSLRTFAEEFNEYFELRLTRLNAILLLLIDYGFSNENYTDEEINNLISLGRYAEIHITQYRDYSRMKKMAETTLNSFKYL